MKLLIYILTALIIIGTLTNVMASDTSDIKEINERVTQLIDLLKDSYASEYTKARHIKISTLSTSEKIAVVVFSVEGFCLGNNWNQFMAVFYTSCEPSEGHPQRFSLLDVIEVGGKGVRAVEGDKISIASDKDSDDVTITLSTKEYDDDPMCCPSKSSKAIYKIKLYRGERLRAIK